MESRQKELVYYGITTEGLIFIYYNDNGIATELNILFTLNLLIA